jgi:hypothetical protein
MKKEQWVKPELIVLMRNHPEDTLQQAKCKKPHEEIGYNAIWNASCAEKAGPTSTQCFNSSHPS